MKRVLICTSLLAAATTLFAQGNPASPPDKAAATIGGRAITITYSSPAVKGREGHIFTKDGLISHNPNYPVWRAFNDPDQWVLIVNKKTGESGLAYDASQDLGKVKMQMSKPPSMVENLKYTIDDTSGGKGKITLAWENHAASVPVSAH